MPDDRAFAAGCALLMGAALEDARDPKGAEAAFKDASESMPEVAELGLAYARLSGDIEPLRESLSIAPDLISAALAAGIPNVDEVAEQLAHADTGPVALAAGFLDALQAIRDEFPDTAVESPLPSLGDQPPVDDVIAAATILGATERIISELRAQQDRRNSDRAEGHRVQLMTSDRPPSARTATPYQDDLKSTIALLREIGDRRVKLAATIEQRMERYLDAKTKKAAGQVGGFWREPEFEKRGREVKLLSDLHHNCVKYPNSVDKFISYKARPGSYLDRSEIPSVVADNLSWCIRSLRELGITELRETAARYEQEWEDFFAARGEELARQLDSLEVHEDELEKRILQLQPKADAESEGIRIAQEARRVRLDAQQEVERLKLEAEREATSVSDARWN